MCLARHFFRDKSYISRHILQRFPRRFKRMIYVASIFGCIYNTETPDQELVAQLNDLIKIANHSESLNIPVQVHKTIWKNLDINHITVSEDVTITLNDVIAKPLSAENFNAIGEYIAKCAPSWLNYGSIAVMANDVVVLIKQLRALHVNGEFRYA